MILNLSFYFLENFQIQQEKGSYQHLFAEGGSNKYILEITQLTFFMQKNKNLAQSYKTLGVQKNTS